MIFLEQIDLSCLRLIFYSEPYTLDGSTRKLIAEGSERSTRWGWCMGTAKKHTQAYTRVVASCSICLSLSLNHWVHLSQCAGTLFSNALRVLRLWINCPFAHCKEDAKEGFWKIDDIIGYMCLVKNIAVEVPSTWRFVWTVLRRWFLVVPKAALGGLLQSAFS